MKPAYKKISARRRRFAHNTYVVVLPRVRTYT